MSQASKRDRDAARIVHISPAVFRALSIAVERALDGDPYSGDVQLARAWVARASEKRARAAVVPPLSFVDQLQGELFETESAMPPPQLEWRRGWNASHRAIARAAVEHKWERKAESVAEVCS